MAQDGFAFSFAGGVKIALFPDFRNGRCSPPEFCHGERFQLVDEGVLQQARGGAFTRPGWRFFPSGFMEKGVQVFAFATGIPDMELFKEFLLQGGGTGLPLFFQAFNLGFPLAYGVCVLGDGLGMASLEAFELGFLVLAFAGHLRGVRFPGVGGSVMVPPGFCLLQVHLGDAGFEAGKGFRFLQVFFELLVMLVRFKGGNALVDGGNGLLLRLEESPFGLQVIDGRDKVFLLVAACQHAGKCGKES